MANRRNTAPAQKDKVDTTSNTDDVKKDDTVSKDDKDDITSTKDEDDITSNIVYVAKRPLMRDKQSYKVGQKVEGLFDEDEIVRLVKMGIIEEA